MTEFTGSTRLRRAIENQRDAGEACFTLPIGEAAAICDECEDELATLLWAKDVPVPVDAGGEVVPFGVKKLYAGDGGALDVELIGFDGRWVVKFDREGLFNLDWFHLSRPDSWEKLEEDVNLGCRDYCERYRLEECEYNVRAHMLERAKALAERGAKEADRD